MRSRKRFVTSRVVCALVVLTCAQQIYLTLDSLQKDEEEREREAQRLATLQAEEQEEEQRRNEQELRKNHKTHSRAASVCSRTSRRRGSSVKPRGSSVKPTDRSVGAKEDPAVAEAAVKERLAVVAKTAKKAATPTVASRATGRAKANSSLITTTLAALSRMQTYMTNTGPSSVLQTIVMLAVIAWMTNNKRMRERIRKFLILCWIKIARTIGMGMKVTYV
jgi:chemotaxis protein histidine kinase CheA